MSPPSPLRAIWQRGWRDLRARGEGIALMQELLVAYGEPHRRYHTVQHLRECLVLLDQYWDWAGDPGAVAIALWFHDAIYDPTAPDNEACSAVWAGEALARAGVAADRIARVQGHILATAHGDRPTDGDRQLVVDLDLGILGAAPPRFRQYERQVRWEYGAVPEAQFRQKRAEVLGHFLQCDPLYHTPALRQRLEAQARRNLTAALAIWSPPLA